MPVNQKRFDRIWAAAFFFLKAQHQIKAALSYPYLGFLFSRQSNADRSNDIARSKADSGSGSPVYRDFELRHSGQLLDAEISNAFDSGHNVTRFVRNLRQLVKVWPKDLHRQIRRGSA